MRWIDIERLAIAIPDGWEATAETALNELRGEIEQAEQQAIADGKDVKAARKNAITKGLSKSSRSKIWRDLAPHLSNLSNRKCWYSESLNSGSDKDVDHFRPKNRVDEDPDHEGYWWLAFKWSNYRYSCQWSNQRRVNTPGGTRGGKSDRFPVSGSFRARQETDDWELEDVDLLDPTDPNDWKLLTFRPNGEPVPALDPGTREYQRAEISIEVYHLHSQELVRDRKNKDSEVKRLVEELDTYFSKITDPQFRRIYKNRQKDLLRLIDKGSEYSAAALAYARFYVYKTEQGHQVKREWLEAMLNSNT
ncbi:hypothetical protein [Leptolyngbya sp. PCC 6406]|uniref:hypothetical protein n=1 Tax=Leptolyngbya sp. PCC 6406 TaxID=1173264 RepID=UPI0002ACB342|nr:hypothetical protein [Leptolyngbya sp. PCC 6406]